MLSLLFPDTNGIAFNCCGLNGTVANSPDGGNFIGGDGDPAFSAAFSQTITGLNPGGTYTLTFYQAAAQQGGSSGDTTEQWQVSLGSDTQLSSLMINPSGGFQPWNQQTMTFTATAASEVLTFLAVGTPAGVPPVSLLDGVSLTASPEPSAIFLTSSVVVLFAGSRMRRQRTKSQNR